MAALDYTVCLHSEVFVTTQGGNFPHFLIGHRRYLYEGHAKTIKPDKRKLALLFDNPKIRYYYYLSSYCGYHCSLAIFVLVLIKYNRSFVSIAGKALSIRCKICFITAISKGSKQESPETHCTRILCQTACVINKEKLEMVTLLLDYRIFCSLFH